MQRIKYYALFASLTLVAVTAFGRSAQDDSSTQEPAKPASPPRDEARLEWPTFEPFEFARLLHANSMNEKSGEFDPLASAKQLRELCKSMQDFKGLDGRNAEVTRKMKWSFVPIFMIELEPLTRDLDWDADELALASFIAEQLKAVPEGIEVDLAKPEMRAEELEKLATWFQNQVKEPIRYGEMILSMEQGPYFGTAADVPEGANVVGVMSVTETLQLKVLDVEGSDRRVAAYRDGEKIWARTFRYGGDQGALNTIRFLGAEATYLGRYGYCAPMSYGENASLFLDAKGNFLFYLLGW